MSGRHFLKEMDFRGEPQPNVRTRLVVAVKRKLPLPSSSGPQPDTVSNAFLVSRDTSSRGTNNADGNPLDAAASDADKDRDRANPDNGRGDSGGGDSNRADPSLSDERSLARLKGPWQRVDEMRYMMGGTVLGSYMVVQKSANKIIPG